MSEGEQNQSSHSQKNNEEENQENQEDEASRQNEEKNNNEINNEQQEEESKIPFPYFEDYQNEIQDDSIFGDVEGKYKYSICILLENDDYQSSQKLKGTLTMIKQNLVTLKKNLEISAEQICIFIFVNTISNESLFNENDIQKLEENKENENEENEENKNEENKNEENKNEENKNKDKFDLLMRERTYKEQNELKNIKYYTIANKYNYILFDVKALKTYYFFLSKLYKDKKLMFSTVITAGVLPLTDSLTTLILSSYNDNKNHGISIAPIEYIPNNLFAKISLYERIHFNIYNMSFYYASCAVPVSSLLCTMTLDKQLIDYLNEYYKSKILENASIDYHDYNLGLNLIMEKKGKYFIKFNYNKPLATIKKEDMSYLDYQKQFIDRYSGYYANFFQILRSFGNISNIIFLIFQILAIATEFLFPSLASMVIYTVLYEAFKTSDYRLALFFTSLYLGMMFASGICSLITKEPKKMPRSNYFLYIFMEVIYALVIVCSVPAMHFANKKNEELDYKFNKAAISLIIILTFIPYIIPFILYIGIIGNNAIPMIMYLFLGAPSSTTIFNIAKVWNAPDTAGGIYIEYRKSIYLIIYLGFNLFIGGASFFMVGRKKRANCLMAFGIIFLVYNFVRTMAVIIKYCHKEENFINEKLSEKIKNQLNGEEYEDNKEEGGNEEEKVENNGENEENNNNSNNNNNENNDEENNNNDRNEEEEKNDEEEDNNNQENNAIENEGNE